MAARLTPWLITLTLLALTPLWGPQPKAAPKGEPGTLLRGTWRPLEQPVRTQLAGISAERRVGAALTLAGRHFPVELRKGALYIASREGARPTRAVRAGRPLSFTVGAQKQSIAFRRGDDGVWWCRAASALRFRVDGVDLDLVDLDVDGRLGEGDGMLLFGSGVALPWMERLPLISKRMRILSSEFEKLRLRVEFTALPGTVLQRSALALLNRTRTRDGLAPAELDAQSSAACSAHATYLQRNGWRGGGDPHTQDPKLPGASPEGASAAGRSVIAPLPLDRALPLFLATYYHRIGPCHPDLLGIGLNASGPELAVVDVAAAYERLRPGGERWNEVIFVPADGARGVGLQAQGELPHEPVPSLASRGYPLMVYFRERAPFVQDFQGSLVRRVGNRRVPVETLPAAQGGLPFVHGIVPAAPLEKDSAYEAHFSYRYHGKADSKTVRFRTTAGRPSRKRR